MPKTGRRRALAALIVLSLTIAVFADYFATHHPVRHDLAHLPVLTLAALLGLYLVFTGSLAMVNSASLRLCRGTMPAGESVLLTMYSAVINFFGPLQSGPAFRALYLKKKHGVKIRDYTLASFVYYFFYAFFSVILLLSGVLKIWLIPLVLLVLAGAYAGRNSRRLEQKGLKNLDLKHWPFMAMAALIQVALLVIIFWIELHTVSPSVTFGQVAVYTGAANLALFVSFTPGAIGFRESFLVFSQNLHHLSNSTIVAANIIDRAVYVAMLLILAVFIFATHANRRFKKAAN
jgi:uncharacterized membrane protein YbhN (UPF0104 family)